jgi:four helix bundle protein
MNKEEFTQRTFAFAVRCARLTRALSKTDPVAREYGKQLLRSSASVGANYRAANRGRSRAEFIAKLGTVEEEGDESIYWMDLLVATECVKPDRITQLRREGIEILSMIVASITTARKNAKLGTRSNPQSAIPNPQ